MVKTLRAFLPTLYTAILFGVALGQNNSVIAQDTTGSSETINKLKNSLIKLENTYRFMEGSAEWREFRREYDEETRKKVASTKNATKKEASRIDFPKVEPNALTESDNINFAVSGDMMYVQVLTQSKKFYDNTKKANDWIEIDPDKYPYESTSCIGEKNSFSFSKKTKLSEPKITKVEE